MRASRYPGQRRLWDHAKTTSTTQRLSSPGQSQRHLTKKYSLELRVSRKSAFCNPNTPTVTQSASFREDPRQNAPFRRMRLFLSGQTQCHLTERRTLLLRPHQKAHSATAAL